MTRAENVPEGEGRRENVTTETDLTLDDHTCCGHEQHGGIAGVANAPSPSPARVAANGTGPAAPSHSASVRPRLPFKARLGLFLAACVLVLGPALWLIRPMPSNAMAADYSVDMSMTGFTPPSFSIPAGEPVSLQLNNVDSPFHGVTNGALHQFAIDDLGIDVRLDGKQSAVITLPALEPGSYEFYCNVCCGGKVNPSMRGTLTVGDGEGTEATKGMEAMEGVSQR